MKGLLHALVALSIVALAMPAAAREVGKLDSERAKVSYMVGMDVAKSLAPASEDIDPAALERAVRNGIAGGKPLIDDADASSTGQALMQRIAARGGQAVPGAAPGSAPPPVDKGKVGLLVGADVGRSLSTLKDEIDIAVAMQAMRTVLAGGKPLLDEAQAETLRMAFSQRMGTKLQTAATASLEKTTAEGSAFLATNRQTKGVFTTPSGLQYSVLRQGAGRRPLPSDRVRVNYVGTLLDGTEFDSSAKHGGPSEFGLGQVIAGWTEGMTMMPIGAKYRFWVPAELGYGRKGSPGIPPNSTLVFDVELLDIL